MEIKIGKVIDKIIVRKNDDLSKVIADFKAKLKLSDSKGEKLTQIVKNAI